MSNSIGDRLHRPYHRPRGGLGGGYPGRRHVRERRTARILPSNRWGKVPNIFRIISRSLSVSGLHQSRIHSDIIDVEIKPRIEHFDFLRFDQFDDLVEAGAEAAREALPSIKRILMEAQ